MSLKDIKTKNKGFTIVELLIVVVVIAILAAITIVSYNGITNQANNSAAESLVATWSKKIGLFYADEGHYPRLATQMNDSSESWHMADSSLKTTAPVSGDGTQVVMIQACRSASTGGAPTTDAEVGGNIISYWSYTPDSGSPRVLTETVGSPNSSNCNTGAVFKD